MEISPGLRSSSVCNCLLQQPESAQELSRLDRHSSGILDISGHSGMRWSLTESAIFENSRHKEARPAFNGNLQNDRSYSQLL